mmetsp:Transcript_73/g.250  ORF Transcript_73/g.250 Transcript_73/m.250 type:complete len:226 (+) Transcript_73:1123-1800(+)
MTRDTSCASKWTSTQSPSARSTRPSSSSACATREYPSRSKSFPRTSPSSPSPGSRRASALPWYTPTQQTPTAQTSQSTRWGRDATDASRCSRRLSASHATLYSGLPPAASCFSPTSKAPVATWSGWTQTPRRPSERPSTSCAQTSSGTPLGGSSPPRCPTGVTRWRTASTSGRPTGARSSTSDSISCTSSCGGRGRPPFCPTQRRRRSARTCATTRASTRRRMPS